MDILYIIGRGSKHDNIELRMSLRSICKYGKGIDRIIVAGYPCDWLSDEVLKVPVPDKYGRKHLNIMNCIQHVVDTGIIDGEFLYSSDDHFYVKPTDFSNYPYYAKSNELKKFAIKGERCYGYHLSLAQTRLLLEKYGLPIINFEQHCNTHMHARVIRNFRGLIDESYLLERGAAPTSLVMNAWLTTDYAPHNIIKRYDLKIKGASTVEELKAQIGDRECFSIGDALFACSALQDYFGQEFPNKCRYEK